MLADRAVRRVRSSSIALGQFSDSWRHSSGHHISLSLHRSFHPPPQQPRLDDQGPKHVDYQDSHGQYARDGRPAAALPRRLHDPARRRGAARPGTDADPRAPPSTDNSAAAPPPQPTTITNPPGWYDQHRQVPPYRPVNHNLDFEQRPVASSPVGAAFVGHLFAGVWLQAVSWALFFDRPDRELT